MLLFQDAWLLKQKEKAKGNKCEIVNAGGYNVLVINGKVHIASESDYREYEDKQEKAA